MQAPGTKLLGCMDVWELVYSLRAFGSGWAVRGGRGIVHCSKQQRYFVMPFLREPPIGFLPSSNFLSFTLLFFFRWSSCLTTKAQTPYILFLRFDFWVWPSDSGKGLQGRVCVCVCMHVFVAGEEKAQASVNKFSV